MAGIAFTFAVGIDAKLSGKGRNNYRLKWKQG